MTVLVTGGAGYIGSHTVIQLLEKKETVLILDDLSNSNPEVIERIYKITNIRPLFIEGDACSKSVLQKIFSEFEIDSVIHFAGFKAVGESVAEPLKYYRNNILSTINLLEVMEKSDCKKLVFSSSATVYGDPETVPIIESSPLSATSPYGYSKLIIENILRDIAAADENMCIAVLRYFNPIGAHESGLIGEDPKGIPNNLMPYITKVAVGELSEVSVFGGDYDTPDGTGVRDYIHVEDLAKGHLAALNKMRKTKGWQVYNLGTGKGYSVLDVINTFMRVTKLKIPYKIDARRKGDVAVYCADVGYSNEALGWQAEADLAKMIEDHWRWQKNNPKGYEA